MAASEAVENSWVFDSLVGFLQGPIWNAPVITFIEQKSPIFELSFIQSNDDILIPIYEEYKDLVDTMLGSYMQDIGITPEQFEEVCSHEGPGPMKIKFHQSLFEQVWAANDFEVFKRMMCQKNVELQLQALEMIAQRCGGSIPDSLLPRGADANPDDPETQIMRLIARSIEESNADLENEMDIERQLTESTETRRHLEAVAIKGRSQLNEAIKNAIDEDDSKESMDKINEKDNDDMFKIKEEVGEDELNRRKEYLKAQRDKLVAMKKKARTHQLETSSFATTRPKTAKAAVDAIHEETKPESEKNDSDKENEAMQIRRALAKRLKQEVVGL